MRKSIYKYNATFLGVFVARGMGQSPSAYPSSNEYMDCENFEGEGVTSLFFLKKKNEIVFFFFFIFLGERAGCISPSRRNKLDSSRFAEADGIQGNELAKAHQENE